MKAFEYVSPADIKGVVGALTKAGPKAKVIAGGIDLLGELKEYIRTPDVVVNLKKVPGLSDISETAKGLEIGALVTLAQLSENSIVRRQYTALAEAAHSVGTPQIRNVGTIGGNLCQRPRCWYYRDEEIICLKKGGTKCYAVAGENEYHAILGGGPSWIVHPSDCAPALIALGASVEISGPNGARVVPLEKFFVLPTENLFNENILRPNEIVTKIIVPKPASGSASHYLKIKEKESRDWALSSAAVNLTLAGGVVKAARVVLGGVAPIPWRSKEAETAVIGAALTKSAAEKAGKAAVASAKTLGGNAYKVPLTANTIKLALMKVGGVS
jgi:xanthine dehydrogenase YagS FAD-binding subunit